MSALVWSVVTTVQGRVPLASEVLMQATLIQLHYNYMSLIAWLRNTYQSLLEFLCA